MTAFIFPQFLLFLKKYLFLYLAVLGLSCSVQTLSWDVWELVPWPGIKSRPPALGTQSLSHWTTRESLNFFIFNLTNREVNLNCCNIFSFKKLKSISVVCVQVNKNSISQLGIHVCIHRESPWFYHLVALPLLRCEHTFNTRGNVKSRISPLDPANYYLPS